MRSGESLLSSKDLGTVCERTEGGTIRKTNLTRYRRPFDEEKLPGRVDKIGNSSEGTEEVRF